MLNSNELLALKHKKSELIKRLSIRNITRNQKNTFYIQLDEIEDRIKAIEPVVVKMN